MKRRLTKQFVDSIKPLSKPNDYQDTTFQGLLIRCHPTGKKTYYYRYRINGIQRSVSLGTASELSPAAARDLATAAAESVRQGKCPSTERKAKAAELKRSRLKTLRTYVDGPYSEKALQRSSNRGHESIAMIKTQYSKWLDLPMSQITPEMIVSKRRERLGRGIKQSTLRRNELELHIILNMAVAERVIDYNPLAGLPLLKEREPRIRFLSPDEEQRLRQRLRDRDTEGCSTASNNGGRTIHGWAVPQCMKSPYTDHLTPTVLLSLNPA